MSFRIFRNIAALAIIVFLSSIVIAFADYSLGVSVGDFIEYRMGVGKIEATESNVKVTNVTYAMRLEVTSISGKTVIFHMSIRNASGVLLGNGTMLDDKIFYPRGMSVNVETGECNQSAEQGGWGFLVPANLQAPDTVPPTGHIPPGIRINKTETEIYLGFNRTVNVLNYTWIIDGNIDTYDALKCYAIFDEKSGMLLEGDWTEMTSTMPPGIRPRVSLRVVSTNIFESVQSDWVKDNFVTILFGVAVSIIISSFVTIRLVRRNRLRSASGGSETHH